MFVQRMKRAVKAFLRDERQYEVNRGLISRYVARSLPRDAVFVECGAFTGLSGKKFCELADLNPDNCHLIEACPTNYEIMKEHCPGYHLYNLAVSGEAGTLPFYVVDSPKDDGTSRSNSFDRKHLEKRFGKENVKEILIRSVPLDVFFSENGLSKVDYLFLNVEGAEYDIFTGDLDFLDHVRFLYLDLHHIPEDRQTLKAEQRRIFDLVASKGFEWMGGHRREHIDFCYGHMSFLWEKSCNR
jgi:FkbM family methyltransferase